MSYTKAQSCFTLPLSRVPIRVAYRPRRPGGDTPPIHHTAVPGPEEKCGDMMGLCTITQLPRQEMQTKYQLMKQVEVSWHFSTYTQPTWPSSTTVQVYRDRPRRSQGGRCKGTPKPLPWRNSALNQPVSAPWRKIDCGRDELTPVILGIGRISCSVPICCCIILRHKML